MLGITIIYSLFLLGAEGKSCRVVSGKLGVCLPIRRCEVLVQLISNLQTPLPEDVGLLLRESFFCGQEDGKVLTCCPLQGLGENSTELKPRFGEEDIGQCELQDGRESKCVAYEECSPFRQMLKNLKKPFPEAVPFLIREVFLCGQDTSAGFPMPRICCPKDATELKEEEIETNNEIEEEEPDKSDGPLPWYKTHPNKNAIANLDTCGRSFVYERIVGGENASLGQYPWLANIGYTISGKVEFKCGGSLIGKQHVLTAAHCVSGLPDSYQFSQVRVGEWILGSNPDCEDKDFCALPPQDFSPLQIIVHPEYNKPSRFRNDIALVKLDRPVAENDFVAPICLPFPEFLTEPYPTGLETEPEVAGWGAIDVFARRFSDILQYVHVPFAESDTCAQRYKAMRVTLGDSQLCAGGRKGEDSCGGDSGSALMLEVVGEREYDPRVTQVGIVSFGPRRCASKGVPAIYTKVASYLQWILDNVN